MIRTRGASTQGDGAVHCNLRSPFREISGRCVPGSVFWRSENTAFKAATCSTVFPANVGHQHRQENGNPIVAWLEP